MSPRPDPGSDVDAGIGPRPSSVFPWHVAAWTQMQAMRPRFPHAVLLHGPQGTGKTAFAEALAQSLLCEAPRTDGHACGTCPSCIWFMQYAHPDFRRVRPEALEEGEADAEGEEGKGGKEAAKGGKAARAPSKDIRIEQVRALGDFVNVSTHRSGKRVILLYPAEALNAASANALLKVLEEPPPETVFVLVTDSLDRLLPTILSRCRKFALPAPAQGEALAWLKAQQVRDAQDLLAEQGGSPLAARDMADSEWRPLLENLLAHLASPAPDAALKLAEQLQKVPLPLLVGTLQRWLHDLLALKLTGKLRYYPRFAKPLALLADRLDGNRLSAAVQSAARRRAVASHPLSPRLFIEDMLLEHCQLYD